MSQTPYSLKQDHHALGRGRMATSIMFMVKFLSSNQTKEATIETTKMYKQEYVTRQIAQQHPTEVVTAVTMAWSDFELLMTGLVNKIFSKIRYLDGDCTRRLQRESITYIGLHTAEEHVYQESGRIRFFIPFTSVKSAWHYFEDVLMHLITFYFNMPQCSGDQVLTETVVHYSVVLWARDGGNHLTDR